MVVAISRCCGIFCAATLCEYRNKCNFIYMQKFAELVKSVEDIGSIMREIRELEDQVDNMNQNEIKENLRQIGKDLKEMKQENAGLISKFNQAE